MFKFTRKTFLLQSTKATVDRLCKLMQMKFIVYQTSSRGPKVDELFVRLMVRAQLENSDLEFEKKAHVFVRIIE